MRQEKVIRRVAKKLGITLREFGRRAGISPPYVQDLIHGRALPSLDVAKRLVIASGGRITFDEIGAWERPQGDDPRHAA